MKLQSNLRFQKDLIEFAEDSRTFDGFISPLITITYLLTLSPYTYRLRGKVRCHLNLGGREMTAMFTYPLHVFNLVTRAVSFLLN